MKKMNKIRGALLAAAIVMAVLLAAEYVELLRNDSDEDTVLKVYIMNEMSNEEHVLAAFEERTRKELGFRVELIAQSAEQYKSGLADLLELQQEADIVFDAPWISMSQNIASGRYLELTEYFESGEYEGLSAAFSDRYLEDSKINGKIYGVPVTKTFYDPPGVIYRKDLLKGYGLGFEAIETLDELRMFFEAVKKHDPDMVPFSVGRRGFFQLLIEDELELIGEGCYQLAGFNWPNFPALVCLSADGTRVEDVVFLGDDASHFTGERTDVYKESYLKQAEWSGYLSEYSLMTSDNAAEFLSGKAASYENTLGEGTVYLEQELRKTIPEAELGFYVANTSLQGDLENLEIGKGLTAWNYACIPASSRHTEEAVAFLDWLFASRENNDLFTLGVEGVDWNASEKDEHAYRLSGDEDSRYTFPAYTLTYNPSYLRYEERLNENEKELILAMADEGNFIGSPLSGYVADCSEFLVEYQALLKLYAEYHLQFMHGTYGDDTENKIREFHDKAEELGLERVRENLFFQIQEFLDRKSD